MSKATVMAVVNQKGGTGKTTTCENLGVGLAMEGEEGAPGRYRSTGVADHLPGTSLFPISSLLPCQI